MKIFKKKRFLIVLLSISVFLGIAVHKFLPRKLYAAPTLFQIVQNWAPNVEQGVKDTDDFITRFDFDGNWIGYDNAKNIDKGAITYAYVYYAVIESSQHYFITYMFYHPKDRCCSGNLCGAHEHDSECCRMVVKKDGSQFGRLESLETTAHKKKYTYIKSATSHPYVYITPRKHAVWGENHALSGSEMGCLSNGKPFPSNYGWGIHYYYGGFAQMNAYSYFDFLRISYDLIDIKTTLWPRKSSPATITQNRINFASGQYIHNRVYVDDHIRPPYYRDLCVPINPRTFGCKFNGAGLGADAPWSYPWDWMMCRVDWDVHLNDWSYDVVWGAWFIDPLSYYWRRNPPACLTANGESYIYNPYID